MRKAGSTEGAIQSSQRKGRPFLVLSRTQHVTIPPFILPLGLLSVLVPLTVPGQSKTANPPSTVSLQRQEASPTATATPTPQSAPPLTEITSGLDELKRLQQEINRRLTNDSERATIKQKLETMAGDLAMRAEQAHEVLRALPSLPELQDLDSEWTALSRRLAGMQETLAANAAVLNADLAWVNSQQDKWTTILGQIQTDASLEELQSRIRQSLDEIQSTKALAEEQLKFTVTLQTRVSERDHFITGVLETINQEKAQVQKGLFQADSDPLWHFAARRETDLGLQRVFRRHFTRDWTRLREFVALNRSSLVLALIAFLLTMVAAIKLSHRLPAWLESDIVKSRFIHIFKRPYSLSVFAGLLATLPVLPVAPAMVRGLLSLLLIIPLIRLLGPMIQPVDLLLLYTLVASNLLVYLIKITTVSVSWKRDLLALLSIGISCLAIWLSRQMRITADGQGIGRSIAIIASRIGVLLMLASFAANLFGFFALSQVLTDGALLGAYYAVILYTAKEVITIILSTLLKTGKANLLAVVREHRDAIMTWSAALLTLSAWAAWILSILNLFTIRDNFLDASKAVLMRPLGSGDGSFTGGEVISFLLVLFIGITFATALRAVLREDVLKRLPVRQGVPFALSTITYYLTLFFVFLLALVAAGVQLSKFTLFTGAFGIGIGFGLQNTINNFASGIVLLFERPIRENDILEVDGTFGQVTRIGMRSTSLRTAEEAEVIVPNSTLVVGKVINWSRLGRRRPVEIPVRVAYGMNPQAVVDLLVKTAATHEDVLREPPPAAYLQRFGEKALEFVLVFWVARYYLHRKVLSEVAIRVTEAFREAGVQVPMPETGSNATSHIDALQHRRGIG